MSGFFCYLDIYCFIVAVRWLKKPWNCTECFEQGVWRIDLNHRYFWKSEMFRFFGTVVNLCVYMYILEIYWAMADADMCKLRKAFLNAIIKSVAFKSFYSKSLHRSTKPVTMLILSFRRNLVGSAKSNSCILIACIFSNLKTCQ